MTTVDMKTWLTACYIANIYGEPGVVIALGNGRTLATAQSLAFDYPILARTMHPPIDLPDNSPQEHYP